MNGGKLSKKKFTGMHTKHLSWKKIKIKDVLAERKHIGNNLVFKIKKKGINRAMCQKAFTIGFPYLLSIHYFTQ